MIMAVAKKVHVNVDVTNRDLSAVFLVFSEVIHLLPVDNNTNSYLIMDDAQLAIRSVLVECPRRRSAGFDLSCCDSLYCVYVCILLWVFGRCHRCFVTIVCVCKSEVFELMYDGACFQRGGFI